MSADEVLWRASLAKAAQQWVEIDKDPGGLCRVGLLVHAMYYDDLSPMEAEFVRASLIECLMQGQGICADMMTPQLVCSLTELLSGPDDVCSRAEYALECVAEQKTELAAWVVERAIAVLKSPDSPARGRAARVLQEVTRFRPQEVTQPIVAFLIECLQDSDREVCFQATYALSQIAELRPDLRERLMGCLQGPLAGPCDATCTRALGILEAMVIAQPGMATLQVAEKLVGLLRRADDHVGTEAQYVLERAIAVRPEIALDVAKLLDDLLHDADADVRARTAHVLEKAVQANDEAATEERVKALAELFMEHDDKVSLQARHTLRRFIDVNASLVPLVIDLGVGRPSLVYV